MASEDVIELGSSDEESRPSKKMKAGPNAMVHIPNSLHGVTIKPSKSSASLGSAKGQKLVKTHNVTVLNRNITKTNGKKLQIVPQKSITIAKNLQIGKPILNTVTKPLNVNPVSLMKKLNNQVMVHKLPSPLNVLKPPIPVKGPIPVIKGPINLPATITVKKTVNLKRPAATHVTGVKKKQKSTQAVREVLTIDSDDEEMGKLQATKPAGPQWYLRPEEQEEIKKQEEIHTEPDSSKFIEITIEDSPVKPVKDKRTCTVGTELAITIDDSPVKPKETSTTDKNKDKSNTPHSKKKLEYPIDTFEIEIEPVEIEESDVPSRNVQDLEKDSCSYIEKTETNKDHNTENRDEDVNTEEQSVIVEVAESPVKKKCDSAVSKPQEAPSKVIDLDLEDDSASNEFHPVYQQFIDMCLKIEDSVDMQTIVEKKIKSYYRQVPKEYTESEEFLDLVSGKLLSMKAGPEKIYLYIKDIVDELNMQRKLAKQQALNDIKKKTAEEDKFLYGEDTEFDLKRQRQIRKLEKTLKKLHRAIQKLEEQEVDFDDEEDSVYLLTERYKERMVRVHAKLCQLTNTKMPSEPRVQIDARPGQPTGPAKRIEKWVNKKVPIGTPLPFPDFHDVLRCVREANKEDKLGWNEAEVMEEARDLFVSCGKKLQRRRQENEWRLAASRISVDVDPAEENEGLKKKLEDNRQLATKKETEVFNKYADRQSLLKLEGEVVGDKEAEESPVESEEEEPVDDSYAMKNKERRKERLRRLLQDKPRNSDKTFSPQKDHHLNEVSDEIKKGVTDNVNDESNVEKESGDLETESKSQVESKDEHKRERVHSISDSSDSVGSDVDELHLLQKLHSGNEVDSSTSESSGSLIDISDTIQSDAENNENDQSHDVISIENSSYSESERSNDARNDKMECDDVMESSVATKATGSQDSVRQEPDVEQVLTVSDEDRQNKEFNESPESDVACMNTQDDAISIGDTEVQVITNKTTTTCGVIESNYNSRELEASEVIKSCSEEQNSTKDDTLYEIAQSSTELKAPLNTDSGLINDTEVRNKKVNDESDLSKTSDKNEMNEDENKHCISNELNLSFKHDRIVFFKGGCQDTDLSLEVMEMKVDDEKVPNKESNVNQDEIESCKVGSQDTDLSVTEMIGDDEKVPTKKSSMKQNEFVSRKVGSQDADLSLTDRKVSDEKVVTKEFDKNGERQYENESCVRNKLNLSLKEDEIMSDKIDSQDARHTHSEICNTAEKSLNNDNTTANKDIFGTDIDKLVEQSSPKNTTETLNSKVTDSSEEILALSNDQTNSKTKSVESNIAFKSTDISDDNNKSSEFKQTDSLELMLEELRSDLEAN